ncbi:efflux RND transporter periplasmic adaptor subunit [Ignatzschineria cameli]|uniref:Efflux RND transporter periplasmic adaptor subunit n=1 Tax=Ignatzschineria cameli TaxID=2182793 RepID=A0A2U2ATF8_9GAMM|nr:efflux RND transporter periplasmic adaptor subunit [Ignatzschineria cameli]PWD88018.1 efflux RND transporter periplasmic adaptor subunit [Ignatzschineria cameli]PWD91050.1 efflux RND transporter periplasmic adaptor subunit [Ignatzschineria cameli]PWD92692.1 efflux RND transporter periplasmic adaptor subunit [Ignatzschineria cameli]PWD93712.1 efflux RND transporter periplasmic adaptor subunit [Ignatzschineria cameli]
MKKYRKYLIGGIIVILALVAYLYFNTEKKIAYLTTPVERDDLEVSILAYGKMEASDQIDVGAQVSGQIKKMYVKLGDSVKKGDLLVEIDDLPQQNAVKDSEARLKNMIASKAAKEAQLLNARINLERQQKLIQNGATTQNELDQAEATLKVLDAEVEALIAQIAQAQIALDTAELNLDYTKITSPIDGMVVATVVKEGQTVNSTQTAPTIVKVADLSTMTIKAQISEADVTKLHPGMKAYFTILGEPHQRYEAVLRQIEPATESFQTTIGNVVTNFNEAVYYNGLFDVENLNNLFYIGMSTQVHIILEEKQDILMIPMAALRFKPSSMPAVTPAKGERVVWVLEDQESGKIAPRMIKVGLSNSIAVEVISGLEEGEAIITAESTGYNNAGSMGMMGRRR